MNASRIDQVILAVAEPRWQKVAMVMAKTMRADGVGVADDDDGYEVIASRIRALVECGRLEAQGDLHKPRFSEVRLP
jgi:hypothetical protein